MGMFDWIFGRKPAPKPTPKPPPTPAPPPPTKPTPVPTPTPKPTPPTPTPVPTPTPTPTPIPVPGSPVGLIDLSQYDLVFDWDFGTKGLGLQKDGGPFRTTWSGNAPQDDNLATPGSLDRRKQQPYPLNLGLYVGGLPGAPDPFTIDPDGSLCITARRTETSKFWGFQGGWVTGMLNSGYRVADSETLWDGKAHPAGFLLQPGMYAECEVRCDLVKGAWPGFWFYTPVYTNGQELDVVEMYPGAQLGGMTIHGPNQPAVHEVNWPTKDYGAFHIYGAEWRLDDKVQGYFDRRPYGPLLDASQMGWALGMIMILELQVINDPGWPTAGPPDPGVNEIRAWFRAPRAYRRR